jgi:Prp8 binding protein
MGKCENISLLKGHKNAILQLCWHKGGDILLTASADLTAAAWDVNVGTRIKQIREHKSFVNCIDVSRRGMPLILTGSDDGSSKIFDLRQRASLATFDCTYQVTACAFNDEALTVYTAGIDNDIKIWDVRQRKQIGKFIGHDDTITHLSLSPDGYYLLSNSMDMRIHCWDIHPHITNINQRLIKTFIGATNDL